MGMGMKVAHRAHLADFPPSEGHNYAEITNLLSHLRRQLGVFFISCPGIEFGKLPCHRTLTFFQNRSTPAAELTDPVLCFLYLKKPA